MKKMNNKGFAISALVYGLAIMGILIVAMLMKTVSSTRENQKLLSEMIEDELNNLGMSSNAFVPVAGDDGQVFTTQEAGLYRIELWGAAGANGSGGRGAYTSGVIYLEEAQNLYFFIGQSTATGGHETDVRLISNGGYTDSFSYETRIMVAGGGGTTGAGRGIVRTNTLQLMDLTGSNGGGDGYIPGTSSTEGGSSFISGYGSSQAIIQSLGYQNDPTYRYNENIGLVGNAYQYASTPNKKYYFVDGIVIPGVNAGAGKATIKRIGNDISKIKKTTLTAKKVEICNTTTPFTAASINTVKISAIGDAISNGGQNFTADNDSLDGECLYNNFTASTIDEITISGLEYNNKYKVTITDSSNNDTVFNNVTPNSSGEFRYSSYQSHGRLSKQSNYYIQAVSDESKFLTFASGEIVPQLLTGNKNQIWEITRVNDTTPYLYKIVEMSKFNAMTSDTNNTVNDITKIECKEYNAVSQDNTQLFKIKYNSDGTYSIVPQSGSDTTQATEITGEGLIVKEKNDNQLNQKFRLITIDYSK